MNQTFPHNLNIPNYALWNFLENPNRLIEEWCVYSIDGPRGNCSIEGNNFLCNIWFSSHPEMWSFVDSLRELNSAKEIEYDQLISGQAVNNQTRIEREKNTSINRLKTLLTDGHISLLNFLESLRHIYHGDGDLNLNEDMEPIDEENDESIIANISDNISDAQRQMIPSIYHHLLLPSQVLPTLPNPLPAFEMTQEGTPLPNEPLAVPSHSTPHLVETSNSIAGIIGIENIT